MMTAGRPELGSDHALHHGLHHHDDRHPGGLRRPQGEQGRSYCGECQRVLIPGALLLWWVSKGVITRGTLIVVSIKGCYYQGRSYCGEYQRVITRCTLMWVSKGVITRGALIVVSIKGCYYQGCSCCVSA